MGEQEYKTWLETAQLSHRTVSEYLSYYKFLAKILTDFEINNDVIEAFISAKNNNVARAFIKNYLEYIDRQDLRVPKIKGRQSRKIPKIISEDEMTRLRQYIYLNKGEKYGLMFDLTYFGALRKSEIIGVQIGDFEWEQWREDRSKPCKLKIRKESAKGKKERYVIIPSDVMEMLVAFVKSKPEGETKLFVGKSAWDRVFRESCMECLGKTFKLHEIRHTRATRWYGEGRDIIQIKNRLGHANISTTQLYINPDTEKEIEAWEKEY